MLSPQTNINDSDKKKALEMALGAIEKQFGKGAIMKLGTDKVQRIPAIPTGALSLDLALGIGGIPQGRIAASKKTTSPPRLSADAKNAN